MYAVIKTGGKQYRVEEGARLQVELLGVEAGSEVTFTPLLVVDGERVLKGEGRVSATVVGETKGAKIVGFYYRPKSRHRKRWGHRQRYATIQITAISA